MSIAADMAGGVLKQRSSLTKYVAGFEVAVTSECTNGDVIASIADETQILETTDVDEHCGRGQAQLHKWQQRMATGEELCFIAVFGK